MKYMFDLTIKNLLQNKKRTVVTFIGIVLSCSLLFGVAFFVSTYRDNLIKTIIFEEGDYHIKYMDIDYNKVNVLKSREVKHMLHFP